MAAADEESTKYNDPLRAQERAERQAIEDKERAAKYGFGSDDDEDDDDDEDEDDEEDVEETRRACRRPEAGGAEA